MNWLTRDDLLDKFAYVRRHRCCDEAGYYLIPPHPATDNIMIGPGQWIRLVENENWVLELDGAVVVVVFCPWCGEKLEEK